MLAKLFLILASFGFILTLVSGNPFFPATHLFGVEPAGYAIFSIICLLFAIALILSKLTQQK